MIRPGGETAYPSPSEQGTVGVSGPDGERVWPLQEGDPGGYDLPAAPDGARQRRVRFRDLPAEEQIRRRVEDALRYVAETRGIILTAEAICDRLHWPRTRQPQVVAAMNDPVTIANLRELGVLPEEVETWDELAEHSGRLTKRQMDAMDAIFERIDPEDPRPLKTILAEHGIQTKTWHGWLADPVFAGYVRDRTAKLWGERGHEIDIALMRRAAAGDVPAIKLALELQGRIRAGTDTVDANALLARVVEIIDLEVGDRDTKIRIAQRLQRLSEQLGRRATPTGPPVLEAEMVGPVAVPAGQLDPAYRATPVIEA